MAPAIGNAWFAFGHVRFAIMISRSLLAIGGNPHSPAWLGRNKKHVRISRQSAKIMIMTPMRMPARVCKQLRQARNIFHI